MNETTNSLGNIEFKRLAPAIIAGLAFALLFYSPFTTLLRDWWNDPEAQHGLLLGPLALFLAWKRGILKDAAPEPILGSALLVCSVLLRYASGLAAELFTLRLSMVAAAMALVVFLWGFKQLLHWWLSIVLLVLSIPLPQVILSSLAFPLQLRASRIGAWLLELREIPVHLDGNIINLPGQTLFVTEACSGLHSLTALVSIGFLLGALWLRYPASRALLLGFIFPIAVLVNGFRVFLTGYLVVFVDPAMGEGFMHMTEGWGLFVVALLFSAGATILLRQVEGLWTLRAGKASER